MIVSEIMKTELITVTPDDTLSHAANLLRQYQFHHLPVVQASDGWGGFAGFTMHKTRQVLEGLLTSNDIDLAVALEAQRTGGTGQRSWQDRRVAEVMHRATIRVTPTTSVAAAAQILVERNLNSLPVIEYGRPGEKQEKTGSEAAEASQVQPVQENTRDTRPLLVGLITRSDLLIALARALGAFEPGMQLVLPLSGGNMQPLAQALLLATELHIQVRSVVAAPLEGGMPQAATLRLGTINPTPFLVRLQEAGIQYTFADLQP